MRLIRNCVEIDDSFQELVQQEIDLLTDYAVDLRYAENFSIPLKEEAYDAIKKAEFVKQFVLNRMG